MMVWFGIFPTWGVLALPLFLLLALMTPLAVSLFLIGYECEVPGCTPHHPLSRPILDVRLAGGLSSQPSAGEVAASYGLNPMVGVIDGFRWALLGRSSPDFGLMAIIAAVVLASLLGGIVYFKRMERIFADVI